MREANELQTDVLIIGAGPTGLSFAAQLIRFGVSFIIVEKKSRTTLLSKAVVVQARTLEIFDEIDLAGKAIAAGKLTTSLNLFYQGKKKTSINVSRLGEGLSPFPFVLSLEQSKTEKLLADHLTAYEKSICWNTEFVSLNQSAGYVTALLKEAGMEKTIRAKYLVGCDGAGSPARHQMGLQFEGETVPKIFYVADVSLSSPVINRDELYMFMIKKGFVLFFPMEGAGHYRVIGILPDQTDAAKEFSFEDIEETVKEDVAVAVEFKNVNWFSSYKVHTRKAPAFQNQRCFIAGDAAHIHTPAGGQGMNTGIQDAYNLAWKLGLTLRGQLPHWVLETYDSERGENARRLLRTTDRLFDLMSGANEVTNFFRLRIFPPIAQFLTNNSIVKKRIFPLLSQTGIAYPESTLTVPGRVGKVRSGMRMPYFVFGNGKHIFEFLREPCFKLLYFGELEFASAFAGLLLPILYQHFVDIPPIFGNAKNFYVFVRPDNHISFIGTDAIACRKFIERLSPQQS